MASKGVFVVAAKRTAFGAFGGTLKGLTATELGGLSSSAAIKACSPNGDLPISSVIFGNVIQSSADAPYLARHVGHRVGVHIASPALTINRLCGSGFQAAINGAHEIILGEAEVVLTGGTENMSQCPYAVRNIRWGVRYGAPSLPMEDTLAQGLVDQFPTPTPMGITAENLRKKYDITREQCDEFAHSSQLRWKTANDEGRFKDEIEPVTVEIKRGKTIEFQVDEHPRPDLSASSLSNLKPVFSNDGVTTAGNASGINDGSASVILASENAISKHNLSPLVRVVSWCVVGVEPTIMGIGPAPAIRGALKRANLKISDMDYIEVNEAFAAQFLAVQKELDLPLDKTNVDGGAIAVGHPLAASGARILGHLAHKLRANSSAKYAIGSACIGGGQGIAVVVERC